MTFARVWKRAKACVGPDARSMQLTATPPVVLSLSSHPARRDHLHKALRELLRLDYPALTIAVYLSISPSSRVSRMAARDSRLKIHRVDRDLGPATKFLYALDAYSDRAIVICDDDHRYTSGWLHAMVAWSHELGGAACVACTGVVESRTIDPKDPDLVDALESITDISAEGVEVYQKLRGNRLRGDPVPILWPQGYAGYWLPPGLGRRLDPFRHYTECLELLPADQLRDMNGRVPDDLLMGAALHRLGVQQFVVPHGHVPQPMKRVTKLESIGALQRLFFKRRGMNMSMATYLALHGKGWL
ncbi:MAG: glycosyltransferase family 2 protein [Deltaproteobacteria bacterium]|nr:glycosyltransferase family 2 protein [Deltaproteobacteria bacterium]